MSFEGSPVQGITQPHPLEAQIRGENAKRVQQRAAYASLASSIVATDFDDLRRDPQRQIGGTFEKLQKIPKAEKSKGMQLTDKDINQFLAAFNFDEMTQITPGKHTFKGASTGGAGNVGTQALKKAKQLFGY